MIRHLWRLWRWNTRNPLEPWVEPFEVENEPLVIETWLSVIEKIERVDDDRPPQR